MGQGVSPLDAPRAHLRTPPRTPELMTAHASSPRAPSAGSATVPHPPDPGPDDATGHVERRYARVAGVGYLLIIVTGIYAEFFVRGGLIVAGDASATAANIAAAEGFFRTALGSEFIMLLADVAVALALYVVFRRVDRNLALLAAFFRLTHAAIVGSNLMNLYLPLSLIGGVSSVGAIGEEERYALALVFLEAHGFGYAIGLVFFGAYCFVLGWLVLRSGYVPRLLGILLLVAGAGYLLDSFGRGLLTDYAAYETLFAAAVFGPAFIAELSFALWLTVKGVSVSNRAARGGAP